MASDRADVGSGTIPRQRHRPAWLDVSFWADWAAVVGLIGLIVIFGLTAPAFLSVSNIHAVLVASAILIVVAVGQTFVVATAGIDLSMAAITTLSSVILGLSYTRGFGILAACMLAVFVAGAAGFLNGLVITRGRIRDFVVAWGGLSTVTGLGLILSGGEPTMVSSLFLLRLSSGHVGLFGYPLLVAAA